MNSQESRQDHLDREADLRRDDIDMFEPTKKSKMKLPSNFNEWLAIYYPTPANLSSMTSIEAAKHSFRKWLGVRPHVLKAAGLVQIKQHIYTIKGSRHVFTLGVDSCSLCQKFIDFQEQCPSCPLVLSGHAPCCDTHPDNLYDEALRGNVEPLIKALQATVTYTLRNR